MMRIAPPSVRVMAREVEGGKVLRRAEQAGCTRTETSAATPYKGRLAR